MKAGFGIIPSKPISTASNRDFAPNRSCLQTPGYRLRRKASKEQRVDLLAPEGATDSPEDVHQSHLVEKANRRFHQCSRGTLRKETRRQAGFVSNPLFSATPKGCFEKTARSEDRLPPRRQPINRAMKRKMEEPFRNFLPFRRRTFHFKPAFPKE
jgi:hypothetical protein